MTTILLWSVWAVGACGGLTAAIAVNAFVITLIMLPFGEVPWEAPGISAAVTVGGFLAFCFLSLPTMGILQSDRRLRR